MNNVPAHVVVVTIGSAGDLFPFLRVGRELAGRGHRVTLLAPQLFAPQAAAAGLHFHGLPADPAVLDDPDLWHPRRGFGVVWRATRPAMLAMRRFVADLPPTEPAVLLAHPLALADADLCRAARPGIKIVAAYLAPSNIRTLYGPLHMGPVEIPAWLPRGLRRWLWAQAEARVIHPAALGDVNAERAAAGLPPVSSLLSHLHALPDLSVTLFPSWFGPAQPDWPQPLAAGDFALYDPAPDQQLAPELAAFLEQGGAPLVFTHGTGNQQAGAYFAHALAAARRIGRRAVFLTPQRSQLPAQLPAEMLWQAYVPLRRLLPHVAALIHHGGIGTTAEALRAGVPQLIVPMAYDQFDNATRVARLHVGASLPAGRATGPALAHSLSKLLNSSATTAAVRAVQQHFSGGISFKNMIDAIHILISKTGKN